MRTMIQTRLHGAINRPATSGLASQALPHVTDGRQPAVQSQLDSASQLGHRFDAVDVQPSLIVGPADDHFEREAERAAGQVMAAMDSPGHPTARPQITPIAGGPAVQREAAGGASGTGPQGGTVSAEVAKGIEDARGAGQPLPIEIRQPAERALGADFSGVRVHTTSQADRLNRQVNADAFAAGRDLFFRRDTFSPDSPEGKRLIAHELTHVVQQGQQADGVIQRGRKKKGEESGRLNEKGAIPQREVPSSRTAEGQFMRIAGHGRKPHGKKALARPKWKQKQMDEKSFQEIQNRLARRDDDDDHGGAAGAVGV